VQKPGAGAGRLDPSLFRPRGRACMAMQMARCASNQGGTSGEQGGWKFNE
jgi:hypothetical protein